MKITKISINNFGNIHNYERTFTKNIEVIDLVAEGFKDDLDAIFAYFFQILNEDLIEDYITTETSFTIDFILEGNCISFVQEGKKTKLIINGAVFEEYALQFMMNIVPLKRFDTIYSINSLTRNLAKLCYTQEELNNISKNSYRPFSISFENDEGENDTFISRRIENESLSPVYISLYGKSQLEDLIYQLNNQYSNNARQIILLWHNYDVIIK